jgi:hypothetical protein
MSTTASGFTWTAVQLVVGWHAAMHSLGAALRGVGLLCAPGAPADGLKGEGSIADRSMIESLVWNSGDDEEAMNKLLMSYKGEIMMAIDSVDSVDLSETDRELMFKHISTIIKQDRIRVRPQNQKAA